MSFILRKGKTKMISLPVAASVVLTDGALVALSSGTVILATSSTTKHVGVCRKTIATTDSDYAVAKMVPVQVPIQEGVIWEALTASAVIGDIGTAVDLTDSVTVNRGGTTHHVVTIVEFYSATKVGVILNAVLSTYNGG